MPQAISRDGGRTWVVSKTEFPALGSNQRPTVLRLQSGRIFFAADYQSKNGKQPKNYPHHGAFVALSEDEGRTWKYRQLTTALPHEARVLPKREFWNSATHDEATLGYAIAAQGPNQLIHLVASMTHPSQEFEMNEAWILAGDTAAPTTSATATGRPTTVEQKFASGKLQAKWSGNTDASGHFSFRGPRPGSTPTARNNMKPPGATASKRAAKLTGSPMEKSPGRGTIALTASASGRSSGPTARRSTNPNGRMENAWGRR